MPACRERTGFGFAVAHHARRQKIGVVKDRAERMDQGVTQFSSFVNRTGRFRRDMARNAAGKRELFEQPLHPFLVLRNLRINFAVGALKISIRHQARPAVAGTGDVNDIQILLANDAVKMHVNEVQPGRRAPMSQQAGLDVLAC